MSKFFVYLTSLRIGDSQHFDAIRYIGEQDCGLRRPYVVWRSCRGCQEKEKWGLLGPQVWRGIRHGCLHDTFGNKECTDTTELTIYIGLQPLDCNCTSAATMATNGVNRELQDEDIVIVSSLLFFQDSLG